MTEGAKVVIEFASRVIGNCLAIVLAAVILMTMAWAYGSWRWDQAVQQIKATNKK